MHGHEGWAPWACACARRFRMVAFYDRMIQMLAHLVIQQHAIAHDASNPLGIDDPPSVIPVCARHKWAPTTVAEPENYGMR